MPYNLLEPDVCHLVYVAQVEFMKESEVSALVRQASNNPPVCFGWRGDMWKRWLSRAYRLDFYQFVCFLFCLRGSLVSSSCDVSGCSLEDKPEDISWSEWVWGFPSGLRINSRRVCGRWKLYESFLVACCDCLLQPAKADRPWHLIGTHPSHPSHLSIPSLHHIHPPTHPTHTPIHPPTHPYFHPYFYPSFYPPRHPFFYPPFHIFTCLSILLSIHPSSLHSESWGVHKRLLEMWEVHVLSVCVAGSLHAHSWVDRDAPVLCLPGANGKTRSVRNSQL